jgi:DNA-binding transcriptional LysR family regulator
VEWDDVRVLLALLRASNLHDAGIQLGVDASTVSRRLANLERELDVRLFARTRDGLRPTPAALGLRGAAEAMEAQAAALVHASRTGEARVAGVVRIATTEAFAQLLVDEGLLTVRRDHPDLVIEVLGGNRPVDLARGDAELAIRLAKLRQPSLRARRLGSTGIGLFASPAYLRSRGPIRGLRGHDVLVPAGELARLPEARWLRSRPGVRVVFRSNSMQALVAAAVAGDGIVPLPLGWGDRHPRLERVLCLDTIAPRKIWLVSSEAASRRPDVRVVANHVVAMFERILTS